MTTHHNTRRASSRTCAQKSSSQNRRFSPSPIKRTPSSRIPVATKVKLPTDEIFPNTTHVTKPLSFVEPLDLEEDKENSGCQPNTQDGKAQQSLTKAALPL